VIIHIWFIYDILIFADCLGRKLGPKVMGKSLESAVISLTLVTMLIHLLIQETVKLVDLNFLIVAENDTDFYRYQRRYTEY
jgi:hypothetical protein